MSNELTHQKIVITGANGNVGTTLLPHLKVLGAQTVALVRKPVTLAGADRSVEDWMNNPVAIDAIGDATTVIHLTGEIMARSWDDYYEANVATTKRVVDQLAGSKVQRVIAMSYIGANPMERNWYLKACGLREQLLLQSGIEAVIFRAPGIVNTPKDPGPAEEALTAKNGEAVQIIGNGQQRMQLIYRGDVVQALLAATQRGKAGVYPLTGPDIMRFDDVVHMINRSKSVRIAHTPGWLGRIVSRFLPDLAPTYVDILLRDAVGDNAQTVKQFGLQLTSLREIWR